MKSLPQSFFDASAMLLSGLCLLHCLALPLLAAALPLFGVWAEAEWVHVVFVAIAAPLAGLALWRGHQRDALPWPLWTPGGAGAARSAGRRLRHSRRGQRDRDDGEREAWPWPVRTCGTGGGIGGVAGIERGMRCVARCRSRR